MPDNEETPHTQVPSKLTCQRVTDVIMDYLNGEMDAEMRAVFESHLHRCSDCAAFFNTYKGTLRTTQALTYESLPTELANRVLQFLHNAIQSPPSSSQ